MDTTNTGRAGKQPVYLQTELPAEDGVNRIGATRVGYCYIFERKDPGTPSGAELDFTYDNAGNQIRRELIG